MDGLERLAFSHRHPVKCGRLKYVNISCPDLDQTPISRLCRLISRYIGRFELRFEHNLEKYDILYVPDDSTPHNGYLVKRAKEAGVTTVVIQHGYPGSPPGFVPLRADYFLCWPESRDRFVSWGMDPKKILTYKAQPPDDLIFIPGIESVFFLTPPAKGRQYWDRDSPVVYDEKEIMEF